MTAIQTITREDLIIGLGPNTPNFVAALERSLAATEPAFRDQHSAAVVRLVTDAGVLIGATIIRN